VIAFATRNKYCSKCKGGSVVVEGELRKEHECDKDHEVSSSSMEPSMFVEMCTKLKTKGVYVASYCADGDTKFEKAITDFVLALGVPRPVRMQDSNHINCNLQKLLRLLQSTYFRGKQGALSDARITYICTRIIHKIKKIAFVESNEAINKEEMYSKAVEMHEAIIEAMYHFCNKHEKCGDKCNGSTKMPGNFIKGDLRCSTKKGEDDSVLQATILEKLVECVDKYYDLELLPQ
jgi:hypothetical protein